MEPLSSPTQPQRPGPSAKKIIFTLGLGLAAWGIFLIAQPLLLKSLSPAPDTIITPSVPQVSSPTPSTPNPAVAEILPPPSPPSLSEVENSKESEAVKALDSVLQRQAEEIAELKTKQQQTLSALTRLNAYYRLQDQLVAGRPYVDELASIRVMLQQKPDASTLFDALSPYATQGIPTFENLKVQFEQSIPAALHPPIAADASWLEKLTHNFSQLVTIRKIGAQTGTTPEAIIARAEGALNAGELGAAVEEIRTLETPASQAFASWMEMAEVRIRSEELMKRLRDMILSDAGIS